MRSKWKVALLLLGTVGGFGSGIAGVRHRHADRDAFERHVAAVCIDAAQLHAAPR